jgi:uncharacterized protein DUF1538
MDIVEQITSTLLGTIRDVLPITAVIFGFQFAVIRKVPPNLIKVISGFIWVLLGLSLFLLGLEWCLFPIGRLMVAQLTDPAFIHAADSTQQILSAVSAIDWRDYAWVYLFAFLIGFSPAIAEPALIAVAIKANEVSGGAISIWGLRIAAALGVAVGITLGCFRIVVGDPIHWYIIAGYIIVVLQTTCAPKLIIPLAYDSGGVTTSTVTVPLIAALGLGLSESVPGRNPLIDGFGLIAFACLFPIISVMAYAWCSEAISKRQQRLRQTPENFSQ